MKKTRIIAIVLIAVAIGVIMSTVSESSTYADFSTAVSDPGSEFHIVGKLNKEKALEYDPQVNANLFCFYMVDNKGIEKKVIYNGTKPQDFEKSEQIVVVGKCSADGSFSASSILMKCPSKYENNDQLGKITSSRS